MHQESYEAMRAALSNCKLTTANVLDVGSYDVNGTYRPLVEERGWIYVGLDIQPGPNVDILATYPYRYPMQAHTYDVVISGNMLHNVAAFWLLIPEMVRVLRPGGLLAIVCPTWGKPPSGAYPGDYWRMMPDGMRFLFDETGQLERYDICILTGFDLRAVAWKKSI